MDLTFQSNDFDISKRMDLVSRIFQDGVKNDELLDQVARGFISPKEAGFRIAGLLMIANEMVDKWISAFENAQSERDALVREAADEHAQELGI